MTAVMLASSAIHPCVMTAGLASAVTAVYVWLLLRGDDLRLRRVRLETEALRAEQAIHQVTLAGIDQMMKEATEPEPVPLIELPPWPFDDDGELE